VKATETKFRVSRAASRQVYAGRRATTMAADRKREEIVTEFFLVSCQLRRPLNQEDVAALLACVGSTMKHVQTEMPTAAQLGRVKVKGDLIPLTTGSVAELYIEPMLPSVGDVDMMVHSSIELAIPAGYSPPTQLPGEFSSRVRVYEIVDSEFPGYVYLWLSYLLTENVHSEYDAMQCERVIAEYTDKFGDIPRHGPAHVSEYPLPSAGLAPTASGIRFTLPVIPIDEIYCMRCLIWPPQAANWPKRQRNYGWPDIATVDHIVSNGCDIVPVAHYLHRHDEWMSKVQRRMSFSRAEIVLLNSWMPVQQVVYHVLRVFMKTEQLTDSAANDSGATLSNYHIKTLMLWACECELKSTSWSTDDLNLVSICVELLHTLADWLTDGRCQHYFINNCNLFDRLKNSRYTQITANTLMSVTRVWFCKWCIDSYLRKCAQLCPSRVSSSIRSPSSAGSVHEHWYSVVSLQNVVSEFVKWKIDTSMILTFMNLTKTQWYIMSAVSRRSLTLQSCLCWMDQLAAIDENLHVYFTAVAFLHCAYKIRHESLTSELMDVLVAACLGLQLNVRCFLSARRSSLLSQSQAAILMKFVANNSHSTVQLIEIELAKAYLHRALRCGDSVSSSVYCLANVYLAVLYYITGQYQTAVDHCTLVTRSPDHSQCTSHVVQGELLPKLDDDIDSVLGLAVFYQFIRAGESNEEQRHLSVFSVELFAHYLCIKFPSVTECHQSLQISLADEFQRYRHCLCTWQEVLVTDMMLFSVARHTRYRSIDRLVMADGDETKSLIIHETSKLVELLQQSAVEHLTKCRELELRDFGSLGHVVTTDFEALYAYKRGCYRHCLQESTTNVNTLISGKSHRRIRIGTGLNIPLCRELIQLMDDEIVSVTGLMLLLLAQSSSESDHHEVAISQLSLSLYLMAQCQIKLRQSVTSLGRTLDYVRMASSRIRRPREFLVRVADQPVLKIVEQKLLKHIQDFASIY